MVIYTLPGPLYDYSAKLVKSQPDVVELDVILPAQTSSSTPVVRNNIANAVLRVNLWRGLTDVSFSITPSDSMIVNDVVSPSTFQGEIVGGSLVVSADSLPMGSTLDIKLEFRRNSKTPAELTVVLIANELIQAFVVSKTI